MKKRHLFTAFLVLSAAMSLAACGGGGGGGGDAGPGGLESWSPFQVLGASGAPEVVTWSYVVNGGQAIEVEESGASLSLTFADPMVVAYDPATGLRSTDAPLSFSLSSPELPGTITGTGRLQNEETIGTSGGATRVTGSSAALTLVGTYLFVPVLTIESTADVTFDEPLLWFPDRDDLDTLAVGFVEQPEADVAGMVAGELSLTSTLVPNLPTTPFSQPFSAPQRWEIVDRLAAFTVGSRTYQDVVVVDLTTAVPDLRNPDEPVPADAAARMWFAKGIGMIRASGTYQIWETPLTLELLSTSLDD